MKNRIQNKVIYTELMRTSTVHFRADSAIQLGNGVKSYDSSRHVASSYSAYLPVKRDV